MPVEFEADSADDAQERFEMLAERVRMIIDTASPGVAFQLAQVDGDLVEVAPAVPEQPVEPPPPGGRGALDV
jgi:hypothetical protein